MFRGFIKSISNALAGIIQMVKQERNMRIHLSFASVVVIFALVLKISRTEWMFIIFAIGFVLVSEGINSALEKASDAITLQENRFIKAAKNMAAGAVLLAVITAVIIGLIVFIPHLLDVFSHFAA